MMDEYSVLFPPLVPGEVDLRTTPEEGNPGSDISKLSKQELIDNLKLVHIQILIDIERYEQLPIQPWEIPNMLQYTEDLWRRASLIRDN